jgi:hypothetical protein
MDALPRELEVAAEKLERREGRTFEQPRLWGDLRRRKANY